MIVGMAKKKEAKAKGELMEQDQDGLEVILYNVFLFVFFCLKYVRYKKNT